MISVFSEDGLTVYEICLNYALNMYTYVLATIYEIQYIKA